MAALIVVDPADVPLCRYAQLLALLARVADKPWPVEALLRCPEAPAYRVRIETRELGLASWHVAEVCAGHARCAPEIAGCLGRPWPIVPSALVST